MTTFSSFSTQLTEVVALARLVADCSYSHLPTITITGNGRVRFFTTPDTLGKKKNQEQHQTAMLLVVLAEEAQFDVV